MPTPPPPGSWSLTAEVSPPSKGQPGSCSMAHLGFPPAWLPHCTQDPRPTAGTITATSAPKWALRGFGSEWIWFCSQGEPNKTVGSTAPGSAWSTFIYLYHGRSTSVHTTGFCQKQMATKSARATTATWCKQQNKHTLPVGDTGLHMDPPLSSSVA